MRRIIIRGILIFTSAGAGLYTVQDGGMPLYLVIVLFFAGLTATETFTLGKNLYARYWIWLLQLGIAYWLVQQFGIALLFLSVSCLFGYLNDPSGLRKGLLRIGFVLGHLISLNIALIGQARYDLTLLLNANLTFILLAALLWALETHTRKQAQDIQHYDELRRQHFELDEARERIAAFAARIEEEAQDEERVRIARKLHDDIGHRLIRIKMMMEAALRILPIEPDKATAMLEQIRGQLEASMEEIRLSVKKVSPLIQSEREYALDQLLEQTGNEAQIETTFLTYGIPYALYPSYRVTLYQNAREALTNALRHGQATSITLTLIYESDSILMEICNVGSEFLEQGSITPATSIPQPLRTGMGIRGMQERTRLLGGELLIEPGPPFTVRTRLPIRNQTSFISE